MKVNEFRKDLKQAFDDALHGESVVIERGGVQFQLVADGVVPKITPKHTVTIPKIEVAPASYKQPTTKVPNPFDETKGVPNTSGSTVPASRLENGVCRIHGLPLDARGRCLQKGCKYS